VVKVGNYYYKRGSKALEKAREIEREIALQQEATPELPFPTDKE